MFVCVLVTGQFYEFSEFYEFMIYVMVLYRGVLILILQFLDKVIGDDVVAHCVLVVHHHHHHCRAPITIRTRAPNSKQQ